MKHILFSIFLFFSLLIPVRAEVTWDIQDNEGNTFSLIPGTVERKVNKNKVVLAIGVVEYSDSSGEIARMRIAVSGCFPGNQGEILMASMDNKQYKKFSWAKGGRRIYDGLAIRACFLLQRSAEQSTPSGPIM